MKLRTAKIIIVILSVVIILLGISIPCIVNIILRLIDMGIY